MKHTIKGHKWIEKQPVVNTCPLCNGIWLSMIRCLLRWKIKYFIECEHCHYCGKTAFTLKGALRKWNMATKEADHEAD